MKRIEQLSAELKPKAYYAHIENRDMPLRDAKR